MAVQKLYYAGKCVMTVDMDYVKEDVMRKWKQKKCFFIVLMLILLCGCRAQPKEPVKIENFTLSEYSSIENVISIGENDTVTIYISPSNVEAESLELVNENNEVALCLIQDVRLVSGKKLAIVSFVGKEVGETSFYLKDINGDLQSEKIQVFVAEVQEEVDNSRKVYLNYSGDKYHYNSSCAGKSAYESTLKKATLLGKEPCSKCTK